MDEQGRETISYNNITASDTSKTFGNDKMFVQEAVTQEGVHAERITCTAAQHAASAKVAQMLLKYM